MRIHATLSEVNLNHVASKTVCMININIIWWIIRWITIQEAYKLFNEILNFAVHFHAICLWKTTEKSWFYQRERLSLIDREKASPSSQLANFWMLFQQQKYNSGSTTLKLISAEIKEILWKSFIRKIAFVSRWIILHDVSILIQWKYKFVYIIFDNALIIHSFHR